MHDILKIELIFELNNNQSSPNAISYKELNSLLNKAKTEISSINTFEIDEATEEKECSDLIANWADASRRLLLMLNKKDHGLTKNRNPKSLMAFGAMGAHINMALQALKATESDQ